MVDPISYWAASTETSPSGGTEPRAAQSGSYTYSRVRLQSGCVLYRLHAKCGHPQATHSREMPSIAPVVEKPRSGTPGQPKRVENQDTRQETQGGPMTRLRDGG